MRPLALLFLAGLAARAPSTPQKPATDPQAVVREIDSLDAEFNRWANWFASFEKMGTMRSHVQRSSIVVGDSIAADIGQYTVEIRDRTDTTKVVLSDHGNYQTSFERRDGEWRAIDDMSVSEVPAPTPTASAPRSGAKE